jgi:hypothetical protein
VRAEALEVVDADGTVRARLQAPAGAGIVNVCDPHGVRVRDEGA